MTRTNDNSHEPIHFQYFAFLSLSPFVCLALYFLLSLSFSLLLSLQLVERPPRELSQFSTQGCLPQPPILPAALNETCFLACLDLWHKCRRWPGFFVDVDVILTSIWSASFDLTSDVVTDVWYFKFLLTLTDVVTDGEPDLQYGHWRCDLSLGVVVHISDEVMDGMILMWSPIMILEVVHCCWSDPVVLHFWHCLSLLEKI